MVWQDSISNELSSYFVEAVGAGKALLHSTADIVHAGQGKLGVRVALQGQFREQLRRLRQVDLCTLTWMMEGGGWEEGREEGREGGEGGGRKVVTGC